MGNVHRGADFDNLTFADFAVSSVAIAPAMDAAAQTGVGRAVYDAVAATRRLVSTNTNLGMCLLIAPLAAVPRATSLTRDGAKSVLDRLTAEDSCLVYEAIRLAQPGGMGQTPEMDVAGPAPSDLMTAMRAAADRDLVARQYAEDFAIVLDEGLPALVAGTARGWSLTDSIVHTHLALIARHGDSLIARKCGVATSQKAAGIASQVLAAGEPGDEDYFAAGADFDFWLRSDGNRRNPGATADVLAAALFAAIRDGHVRAPWR
jgi:triphosphoribosyl-dephospho-CoA synthase